MTASQAKLWTRKKSSLLYLKYDSIRPPFVARKDKGVILFLLTLLQPA